MPPVDGGDVAMISCNVAPINSPKINGEVLNNSNNGDKNEENRKKCHPRIRKRQQYKRNKHGKFGNQKFWR